MQPIPPFGGEAFLAQQHVERIEKWVFGDYTIESAGGPRKVQVHGSIGMMLAVRNLMTDLRSAGEVTGGPKSYSPRDRSTFLSALDQTIRRIQRQRAAPAAPNQN